jgi:predicted dehydrogenase
MRNRFQTITVFMYCTAILLFSTIMSCTSPAPPAAPPSAAPKPVRLLTLDPGHFHAALVQKSMYVDIDSVVHVYAPEGPDVQMHLDRIKAYDAREKDPTHWVEQVYTGKDFFEKMIADKAGNTVVLSGNNRLKADYILGSLKAGLNVLADKPMVIDSAGFALLLEAFALAQKDSLLLYDIMTERFEITTILQREFSMLPDIFGAQEKGDTRHPGVEKTSTHHFYKQVSGKTVTRPPWFFDTRQQGEGMVDVMTHLVDLVQWECFPEQTLDYTRDIRIDDAKHWPAGITRSEFKELTGLDSFPAYLQQTGTADGKDGACEMYCNGQIDYRLRGVHIRTTALWSYKDPQTAEDTYFSRLRGSKADLVISQGAEEQFKPTLYIEPVPAIMKDPASLAGYTKELTHQLEGVRAKYPGIALVERAHGGWMVTIPDSYKEGHEAHFARVMQHFLGYLKDHNMPAWETPNMIAKYFTTTRALQIAGQQLPVARQKE